MLKYREYRPSDAAFIVTSWANSYRPIIRWLPRSAYYRWYRAAILDSLNKNKTIVACLQSCEDVICGWAHGSPGTLHYAFVKSDYRGVESFPLAREMIDSLNTRKQLFYTHWTLDFRRFAKREDWVYRPDLFRPEIPRKDEA